MTLNPGQERALAEILAAFDPGDRHLLTGYAGSGKTFLMQRVAIEFMKRKRSVVLTAPTHKAVAVLASKTKQAGIPVECQTIHSLLSLKPETKGDRQEFVRKKFAPPVTQDVVVVDECSMLDSAMMRHIRRHLPNSFVLFVGDPAQLPPVGEVESESFATKSRSHLDVIVRQGSGNPVLDAAHTIRASQGGPLDMSWCKPAKAPPLGVFVPADAAAWMRKAFTSPEFDADPDKFRYIAWTNNRVAEVNKVVRKWRYGDNIPTPFMRGERALVRKPIIHSGNQLFATNEEADVVEIWEDVFRHQFIRCGDIGSWTAEIPSWRVDLRNSAGEVKTAHAIRDPSALDAVVNRIKDEASIVRDRWNDLHEFNSSIANLQSIYALTTHNSQGSTFTNAFVDVADMKRRARSNLLEAQQLFYVAATRPTNALILVNAT